MKSKPDYIEVIYAFTLSNYWLEIIKYLNSGGEKGTECSWDVGGQPAWPWVDAYLVQSQLALPWFQA